ncbi:MAG: hypothetical protein L6365_17565 [Desulfobulbaceae bacterium]|nr:hypothetical protein [Pseudomonadota bacterium]MCG2749325.1 hypothetical protein [Desulfobulbaceae bacterium]
MKTRKQNALIFMAILASLFLMPISYGHTASVRQVSIDEMLQQCQFVFEGKVIAIEAKENDQKRIHTYVTFEIQEIIKGEYPSGTITLSFMGGTIGDVTMAVSDMKYPQVDEHGIYFVESLSRAQVHPLYGWSQGHFIVEPDDSGVDRIMTSDEHPVTGVTSDMPVKQMMNVAPIQALSTGVAQSLSFAQKKKDTKGLTADEFKNALHELMRRGNE